MKRLGTKNMNCCTGHKNERAQKAYAAWTRDVLMLRTAGYSFILFAVYRQMDTRFPRRAGCNHSYILPADDGADDVF